MAEFDPMMEVMKLISALDKAKDPSYEAAMRRAVPSKQPAHATRVPEMRKIAAEWVKGHRRVQPDAVLYICESLWATGWREERLLAIELLRRHEDAFDALDWEVLRTWSAEVDNWELIDAISDLSGRLLQRQPRLLGRLESLASSDNPWQRRFALVTLIVAGRDFNWRRALSSMTERLSHDWDDNVRKAVTWARRELKKNEASV